ncbi:MAG: Gfo/Idh/MocA family oxidoreductase [Deltaproteobacteria bacterium]|nr:Gfo/Idh/MocA family oxidoreductase [Deltaproteobacteria bacterium]
MADQGRAVDLLIVGAGMYVCGKGTDGYGTILPAALEACRAGLVRRIHIAAQSGKSAGSAMGKAEELRKLMGVDAEVTVSPLGSEHDGSAYLKAADALAPDSAAIISVPDQLHYDIARQLIERRVHVQVVKPLVPGAEETRALIALRKKYNVLGLVEFHKRFDESNLKLRELIESGALGELLNFRIQYSQRKMIPTRAFRGWIEQTDIFQYLGVHYVDLIHFLTGAKPARVMSYGLKKYLVRQGVDTFDTIQTLIEWQQTDGGDFLSSHLTGWIDPDSSSAMSDQRLEVVGTRGRCRVDQKNRGVSLSLDGNGAEEINPYFTQLYPAIDGGNKRAAGYGPESILSFLRDVRDIKNGVSRAGDLGGLRATFETSLYVAAVLEASRRSLAEKNRWVDAGPLWAEV